jgi:hypothetical protein
MSSVVTSRCFPLKKKKNLYTGFGSARSERSERDPKGLLAMAMYDGG